MSSVINVAASQGWIKAVDPKSGQTYYANTVTRKTQWEAPEDWFEEECPPPLPPDDASDDEDELPSNWEVMHDPTTGKPFYVDHNRKITQWTRPRKERKQDRVDSQAPANTTTQRATTRNFQATGPTKYNQPRTYLQEASYFQPAHFGHAGEIDLSDSMPPLDFAVKKVADKYRLECPQCNALFTLSKRRHHCRLCGDIFCDTCSTHRVSLPLEGPEFEKPVRVCDLCHKDVEQGNFFSLRRYFTPLTLYDPESGEDDKENGVATSQNVNAALAALSLDLDQLVQNAEGFEGKVTIPPHILVPNIIKHLNKRADTSERAIRALASLLSLGSMVGKSSFAKAVYDFGRKQTIDQILDILEQSGTGRRTLFVQEKAAQVIFYLTESQVMSSLSASEEADASGATEEFLDMRRCVRNMLDHSSTSKNPNLQRWSTACVRNLVIEDQRRSCLAINDVAARVSSGEVASTPTYESFLGHLVSTGGIMILCSLIGADDSDTKAHATAALGAVLGATRAIDESMSALSEITGGVSGKVQRQDGAIIRAITAGSAFGSSISQLLLSADNTVASMGCNFVASLVLPLLLDPGGTDSLPSKYDSRNDSEGLGACREAALEIIDGGCLPALLSLVRENGRLTRPLELRCVAMEALAATSLAIGGMGRAWADGKFEEGMLQNGAPAILTRAVSLVNEEQCVDVALEILESSSLQSLDSQRETPAVRIREAAGIVLGAVTSCSAEAIKHLYSRQVLSKLVLAAYDSAMTAPSTLRGDNAPRCLGMLEAASDILAYAWQHLAGPSSELLDRLIEVLDVGVITYLFRALTFKIDWDSRDKSIGGMKASAAACRMVCTLFGIALTEHSLVGIRRLMQSCDADQSSRRISKGPRNIMEAVLTALQVGLTYAHKCLAGDVHRSAHYHAALLDLVEAALLATGSMCGSSIAPGGNDGATISGYQFFVVRADNFESRRREVCKVACDIVVRVARSGSALLPTMLIGGFGEGSVGASLRLALAIAQNGSEELHSKLALSGIVLPVGDMLKAALISGDLYRFSAALALVRFCGPHVSSGTNGGVQSVRDAIQIATNVLTLPVDPTAVDNQTKNQEMLKAECIRAIESLSKNSSLLSAISNDALPSIIVYLDHNMNHLNGGTTESGSEAAAMRAVFEIVQVPSHAVYAAEIGLADSIGNFIKRSSRNNARLAANESASLALKVLHVLASRQESRRQCHLATGMVIRSICGLMAAVAGDSQRQTGEYSNLAFMGVEILHYALADIESLGDVADVLNSKEAKAFLRSVGGDDKFVRTLCSTFLRSQSRKAAKKGDNDLEIPPVYGPGWQSGQGTCAGYPCFDDAMASLLFTLAAYAAAIESSDSVAFWTVFLAQDLFSSENEMECRKASLVLSALFLSLMSAGYSGFSHPDAQNRTYDKNLLYPLIRHKLLESITDLIQHESKGIDGFILKMVIMFEIPRICLSFWEDPALLELAYQLLTILVDQEPEVTLHSFVESKEAILSLFGMLNSEAAEEATIRKTDTRRFLASALESLGKTGALADAVKRFDVRSIALRALAAACLAEEINGYDEEEDLTSTRLASALMQCMVDLCSIPGSGKGGDKVLHLEPTEASSIANELGKKICHMVISRFLERAKKQQYQIDDEDDIMTAPDVAMLCAIAQHETALYTLRNIGGFHALSQIAAEGKISAIEALGTACKEDPTSLLEAETYLSILFLFSDGARFGRPRDRSSEHSRIECAAFHLLSRLCSGSEEGRRAVTSSPTFSHCFDRAVEIASFGSVQRLYENEVYEGLSRDQEETRVKESLAFALENNLLVEAAYALLSSTASTPKIQKDLATNHSFIEACKENVKEGKTREVRIAALHTIVCLSRDASPNNALSAEDAADFLLNILGEESSMFESSTHSTQSPQVLVAEGLFSIFDRLKGQTQQRLIQETGKFFLDTLKVRSLSKLKSRINCLQAAMFCHSLMKTMLVAMGNTCVEISFASYMISPLIATVQWFHDSKTILDPDEKVYWEACVTLSLLILASWLEEGKPLLVMSSETSKPIDLKDNVWMVARPGKSPRKAIDFPSALFLASKSGESTARLAAERIVAWMGQYR